SWATAEYWKMLSTFDGEIVTQTGYVKVNSAIATEGNNYYFLELRNTNNNAQVQQEDVSLSNTKAVLLDYEFIPANGTAPYYTELIFETKSDTTVIWSQELAPSDTIKEIDKLIPVPKIFESGLFLIRVRTKKYGGNGILNVDNIRVI